MPRHGRSRHGNADLDVHLLIGVLSLLVAIGALYYAWRGSRSARRSVHLADKTLEVSTVQLALARDEAARRPVLEVRGMKLLHASQINVVAKAASERRAWITAKHKHDRDKGPAPSTNQRGYEGPWPDRVLLVDVSNKGKAAALDVYGHVGIDGEDMWPLEFPGVPVEVDLRHERGIFLVHLRTPAGSRMLPEPTDQNLSFQVPIRTTQRIRGMRDAVKTTVEYAFTTLQGDSVEGEWQLEIPYLEPHEQKWIRGLEDDR
jgi:hypothetical protein